MASKNTLTLVLLTGLITFATLYALGVAIDRGSGKFAALMGFEPTVLSAEENAKETLPVLEILDDEKKEVNKLTVKEIKLDVPNISQMPELYNGCEITSLTMLLHFFGEDLDKMKFAQMMDKDPAPMIKNNKGEIISWGNPQKGFVGDINGYHNGFGVFHKPVAKLIERIMPGHALDLTGQPFEKVLIQLQEGKPVVVWTNTTFARLDSGWMTWDTAEGPVRGTWKEHAVLLVGFDQEHLYINDPLDGSKSKRIDRKSFIESWKQMGEQAVSYQ
ncbi:MAG: C39 family peptidase [Gorillibacterium sp.]|nr:C39 family peptidase [Gorillibacterium sp.]